VRTNGMAEQVDVVVVGAGQAGLAVSYYLRAFGVEHVVLERGRIGESWQSARWDSFTLVTPNWMTRLPGYRMAAGTGGDFPPRGDVVAMLERLAGGLPVRERTEVTLVQSDASRYRSPDALPAGAVLVVGSGQSGAQIADELALAGRDVLLATSRVPRVPRRYRGRDVHEWAVELGAYDQPAEAVSDPAEFTEPHPMLSGAHGGHTVSYQQLARDGVRLLGRLTGAEAGKLRFGPDLPGNVQYADARAAGFRRMVDEYVARTGIVAAEPDTDPAERPEPGLERSPESLDIRAERIATVVWCTGFGPDTGWLHVPVLMPGGAPAHSRGVTAFPGLYVAGYPWLSNRGSGLLYGAAADAARVAQHIAATEGGRVLAGASRSEIANRAIVEGADR